LPTALEIELCFSLAPESSMDKRGKGKEGERGHWGKKKKRSGHSDDSLANHLSFGGSGFISGTTKKKRKKKKDSMRRGRRHGGRQLRLVREKKKEGEDRFKEKKKEKTNSTDREFILQLQLATRRRLR